MNDYKHILPLLSLYLQDYKLLCTPTADPNCFGLCIQLLAAGVCGLQKLFKQGIEIEGVRVRVEGLGRFEDLGFSCLGWLVWGLGFRWLRG